MVRIGRPRAAHLDLGLSLIRGAWLIVTLWSVSLFVVGLPSFAAPSADARADVARLGLPAGALAAWNVLEQILPASITLAVAVLLVWHRRPNVVAWLASIFLVLLGFANGGITSAVIHVHPQLVVLTQLTQGALTSCMFLLFFVFPDGRFVPGWLRYPALALTVVNVLSFVYQATLPPSPEPDIGSPVWYLVLVAIPLVAQVYRYRRVSGPVQRQQTKWVVFGFFVFLLGFVVSSVIAILYQAEGIEAVPWMAQEAIDVVFGVTGLAIPITIGFAVLEHRLFDVDVVIRRTLTYALLTGLLVATYFASIVLLQRLFVAVTGQQSDLAIVASTLAIAALFQPLRRRTQVVVDRRFYRQKYDAAKVLSAVGVTLRDEVDLSRITSAVLTVVEDTLQPEHTSLWLRPLATGRSTVASSESASSRPV